MIDSHFCVCYTIYSEVHIKNDHLVEELKKIIRALSMEIRDLRDENESLWLMLDEIKESDIALKKQLDISEEAALIEYLSKQSPIVGEA